MNNKFKLDAAAFSARIDSLAEKFDASGVVGVFKAGQTLHLNAYGYSDREQGEKLTLDTPLCLSLQARFLTGLCVLLLADRKKLKLSDTLDNFVPEYAHANRMTLKQLLQGGAGVPCYVTRKIRKRLDQDETLKELPEHERLARERVACAEPYDVKKLLEEIGGADLAFEPGQRCEVGESETVLLIAVLERVSGMRYFDFLKQNVFEPLDMAHTVEGNASKAVYSARLGTEALCRMKPIDGPMLFTTTAADMQRLALAFAGGALLSKRMWKTALKTNTRGVGLGFEEANGISVVALDDAPVGNLRLYFSQENDTAYFTLLNEDQKMLVENGRMRAFCPMLRHEAEGAFTYLKNPRVAPCGQRYGYAALDIEIEEAQLEFVPDAKTCIAMCAIERKTLKPFVLVEGKTAVGFIALRVDPKKDEYGIELLLVDRRFQNRGYGKVLLGFGLNYLKKKNVKEIGIGVNRMNHVARRLYESLGFMAEEVYDGGVYLKKKL